MTLRDYNGKISPKETQNGAVAFMKIGRKTVGRFSALTANIIFGFSFIFSKKALEVTEPLIILSVRFTVAFVVMTLIMLLRRQRPSFRGKPVLRLFAMAAAQPLLYFIFELYGLNFVSSALSGVIIALVPIAVMLLSALFLSEKPNVYQAVCAIASLFGISVMSIISNDGSRNSLLGILLLAAAVLCAAVFNVLSRSVAPHFTAFERTWFMMLVACPGFNLISAAVYRENYFTMLGSALSSPDFVVAVLYLAVISSVAAFFLYNYSSSVISAIEASSFSNIVTVVTVLAGVLILKESFSPPQYLLCLLILFGVWGVNAFAGKWQTEKINPAP